MIRFQKPYRITLRRNTVYFLSFGLILQIIFIRYDVTKLKLLLHVIFHKYVYTSLNLYFVVFKLNTQLNSLHYKYIVVLHKKLRKRTAFKQNSFYLTYLECYLFSVDWETGWSASWGMIYMSWFIFHYCKICQYILFWWMLKVIT